jgi:signal transduction histidine kinase
LNSSLTPELLAAACHDLRGPLGAIGTWVHVLASAQADPATRAQALAAMGRDVRAQGELLEQLGELAALVAGELPVKPVPVELLPLLNAACTGDGNARIESDPEAFSVQADPERLRRLLGVLVTSAIKRAAEASVAVRVGREPQRVTVRVEAPGAPRLVSVALVRGLAECQGGSLDEAVAGDRTTLTLRLLPA